MLQYSCTFCTRMYITHVTMFLMAPTQKRNCYVTENVHLSTVLDVLFDIFVAAQNILNTLPI